MKSKHRLIFIKIIHGILWVVFCQQLASMTWFFIHGSVVPRAETGNFSMHGNMKQSLFQPVLNKSMFDVVLLFGSHVNTNDSEDYNQIVKTHLNLQLVGILASSIPTNSIAIISRNGQQQSVLVGDVIPGTDAKIDQILPDRIIINRQQQQEVLLLDDDRGSEKKTAILNDVVNTHQKIKNSSAALLDYLNISPVEENNHLQGYRLNSGKNPDLFKKFVLQRNDLAIALNGVDLKNEQNAIAVTNDLNNLTAINLTVLRDGSSSGHLC